MKAKFKARRDNLSVEVVASARLPTLAAEYCIVGYRSRSNAEAFIALCLGDIRAHSDVLVRIHSQCLTGEVFGSARCDCGEQLRRAMELIAAEGRGVLVYQLQEGRGIGLLNKIRAYALQDVGADTIEANELLGFHGDIREFHQCAEILVDLGLSAVRVLTNNLLKVQAIENVGLQVVKRVPLEINPHEAAKGYLRTKKEKMGHVLAL